MQAFWFDPRTHSRIVSRYVAGESEKALANEYGVQRAVIRRHLIARDVQPRNRSEGMYARMARTSPEDRQKLAAAAHDAVRGVKHSWERRAAHALTVEATPSNVSPAEVALREALESRGLTVTPQKAVGIYNVDLLVHPNLAVEILGGNWHASKSHGKRLRYLLDQGLDVAYVWVGGTQNPMIVESLVSSLTQTDHLDGFNVFRGTGSLIRHFERMDKIPDNVPTR